jgi:putative nucleotidyltransferase with HDIG domain
LLRWTIWTAMRTLVAGAAGLAGLAAGGPDADSFGRIVLAVAAASAAEVLADVAFNAATVMIRGTASLRELARLHGPILLAAVPLYTPVIALLVYAYRTLTPWSVVLFAVPAFAAQRLFLLYREQRDANERLERANLSFASALVATLDARDRYTAGHSAAVAIYARDIATALGLPEDEQRLAHLSGLVHDIGKVGLPPALLEKPGALTGEERLLMEAHAEIGERILRRVDDYTRIAAVVRHHHERVDGHGYPDALAGESIPLLARVVGVADAYNAMTSDRPYRIALPAADARARLAEAAGIQFDVEVVAAFERVLDAAEPGYHTGSRADFSFDVQEELRSTRAVA